MTRPFGLVFWPVALLLTACNPFATAVEAPADAPVQVTSVDAVATDVAMTLHVTGQILAWDQADVAAGTNGKLEAVYVDRGSIVHRGDVLARVDARQAAAMLDDARAMLEQSKVDSTRADADCGREQKLFEQGLSNDSMHQQTQAGCSAARARAASAQAHVDQVQATVSDSSIKAPFDGIVADRKVDVGEYVTAPQPVVTLVGNGPLRLELRVPADHATEVAENQSVTFAPSTAPDLVTTTTLTHVGPSLSAQSRDLVVEGRVENPNPKLKSGMFVTADIELGRQTLPVVPRAALVEDAGIQHLFVVVGGKLEERIVQLVDVPSAQAVVPVLVGLAAGEKVASPVSASFRDGSVVAR